MMWAVGTTASILLMGKTDRAKQGFDQHQAGPRVGSWLMGEKELRYKPKAGEALSSPPHCTSLGPLGIFCLFDLSGLSDPGAHRATEYSPQCRGLGLMATMPISC